MSVRRGVLVFLVVAVFAMAVSAQIPGEAWVRIGLLAGNVTAVGVSPAYNSDTTLYAGLAGSGLWRSYDRGTTWAHLSSVPDTATITAIAFDPRYAKGASYPYGVYVATNSGYVYASFDDFTTVNSSYMHQFVNQSSGLPVPVTSLAVPTTGSWQYFLFVGTRGGGIYYSYTYGWGPGYNAASSIAGLNDTRALATGPSGQLLAAGVYTDGGPVFSYGGGTTWTYKGPAGMVNKTPTALAIAANNTDVFLTVF